MPITLKQLFVPFLFLICGWILGILQFLREKMHAHFRRQRIEIQQRNVPVVPPVIEVPLTITDISSRPIPAKSILIIKSEIAKKSNPPVKPNIPPTKSPASNPNIVSSRPVLTNKSDPPVQRKIVKIQSNPSVKPKTAKKSKPVIKPTLLIAAPAAISEPALVVIDISSDPETESHNEEMELKTVARIVDVHQQPPKEKATGTKPKIQPKTFALVK